MSVNVSKCKVVSYGRNKAFEGQYFIDNERLKKDTFKDLDITFDSSLRLRDHIMDKINKAYSFIGVIKRNFMYLSEKSLCTIYKAMIRSQLECKVSVWCPYNFNFFLQKTDKWDEKLKNEMV